MDRKTPVEDRVMTYLKDEQQNDIFLVYVGILAECTLCYPDGKKYIGRAVMSSTSTLFWLLTCLYFPPFKQDHYDVIMEPLFTFTFFFMFHLLKADLPVLFLLFSLSTRPLHPLCHRGPRNPNPDASGPPNLPSRVGIHRKLL